MFPVMAIATSKRVRFTVAEYFRMSEAGVFDDRRVELLDGRILQMHAQSNPHMAAITRTNVLLTRYFGDTSKFWLVIQGTYVIEPFDAPDPDFHLYDVPVSTPDKDLPRPFLVIEVAYTTCKRDSGIKLRRYAAAGVQDYWIVNIPAKRVEVYRNPHNPTGAKRDWCYDQPKIFGVNAKVRLLAYPKIELPVREMLP
jgi:Uma2 family endonuclease